MSFTIKIADCNDPGVDLALRNLFAAAYHHELHLPEKFLAAQLDSKASMPGFFLVAEENNEIIGCNGFLANDFTLTGRHYVGFQSFCAATHPAHQGRKIFSGINDEAKKILKEKGAGFIYGIANEKSNPILKNKLDFIEIPALVLRIPNIPFFKRKYFRKSTLLKTGNACTINEVQVKDHKLAQFPSLVKLVTVDESWLWGKLIKKRKFGLSIPVFYIGGVQLNAAKDLEILIDKIFKVYKPWGVQFFSCSSNTVNDLLVGWKKPKKMNGFIFHNLNMPAFDHFNMMIGPIDVF